MKRYEREMILKRVFFFFLVRNELLLHQDKIVIFIIGKTKFLILVSKIVGARKSIVEFSSFFSQTAKCKFEFFFPFFNLEGWGFVKQFIWMKEMFVLRCICGNLFSFFFKMNGDCQSGRMTDSNGIVSSLCRAYKKKAYKLSVIKIKFSNPLGIITHGEYSRNAGFYACNIGASKTPFLS